MRSFLLEQLARLIIPLALMLGLSILLKGHNAPGGGFVGGLAMALAGILATAAYGTRVMRARLPFEPERLAVAGVVLIFCTVFWPLLIENPALTHQSGDLPLVFGLSYHWNTALFFDIGVMMAVGGGGTAAALWLWERHPNEFGITHDDGEEE